MKKRRPAVSVPPGYMDALGKLYGKQPIGGPETALESTQTAGALPMHHPDEREAQRRFSRV